MKMQSFIVRQKITWKKLRNLKEIKTEFISVISHELKTPLTPILGYIDVITSRIDDIDKDKIKEFSCYG